MTTTTRLPLCEPLRAVRLLSRAAQPGSRTADAVQWLAQLGELQRQRQAEAKSLQATAQAVQRALQQLQTTVAQRLEQVAATAVELGLAVAREIVGDVLDRGGVDPTPTVARCLRDCVHGADQA